MNRPVAHTDAHRAVVRLDIYIGISAREDDSACVPDPCAAAIRYVLDCVHDHSAADARIAGR